MKQVKGKISLNIVYAANRLDIGLWHFPLLLQTLVSLLFTPPLPSNPTSHQLSHKELFLLFVTITI